MPYGVMISTGSSNLPCLGLNPGGATMKEEELLAKCQAALFYLEVLWDEIEEQNLQDSQITLDFLDKLNEISVRN